MSWQNAKREAEAAVDRLQLKNDQIRGRVLDLDELFADHPATCERRCEWRMIWTV